MRVPSSVVISIGIGLCIGCGATYGPAENLLAKTAMPESNKTEVSKRAILLRGTISFIDAEHTYVILRGMSPYSLNETAPFRITLSDDTYIWIDSPATQNTEYATTVSAPNFISANRQMLHAEMPVVVRIERAPGALRATSVRIIARAQ